MQKFVLLPKQFGKLFCIKIYILYVCSFPGYETVTYWASVAHILLNFADDFSDDEELNEWLDNDYE